MGEKKVCKIWQEADILNSEFSGHAFQSHYLTRICISITWKCTNSKIHLDIFALNTV